MTVEAAVAIEVAEIGRNTLGIPGVIAEYRDRHLTLEFRTGRGLGCLIGDIHRPLVVTADMGAHLGGIDEDFGLLSGAIELQEGATVRIGICDLKLGAVPALTLIVADIGIDGVTAVEAMRQGDGRPGDVVACGIATPDLPGATQRALVIFPSGGQALDGLGRRRRYGDQYEEQTSERVHGKSRQLACICRGVSTPDPLIMP